MQLQMKLLSLFRSHFDHPPGIILRDRNMVPAKKTHESCINHYARGPFVIFYFYNIYFRYTNYMYPKSQSNLLIWNGGSISLKVDNTEHAVVGMSSSSTNGVAR
jgi:hypothetical protein